MNKFTNGYIEIVDGYKKLKKWICGRYADSNGDVRFGDVFGLFCVPVGLISMIVIILWKIATYVSYIIYGTYEPIYDLIISFTVLASVGCLIYIGLKISKLIFDIKIMKCELVEKK